MKNTHSHTHSFIHTPFRLIHQDLSPLSEKEFDTKAWINASLAGAVAAADGGTGTHELVPVSVEGVFLALSNSCRICVSACNRERESERREGETERGRERERASERERERDREVERERERGKDANTQPRPGFNSDRTPSRILCRTQ